MIWILIIASACYPTMTDAVMHGGSTLTIPRPPAPRVESKAFQTKDALNAFVLQRIVWGSCSETLVAVSPDGKVYRVAKVEKTKPVVREVLEHDGFNTEWTQFKEAKEVEQ